MRIIHTNEIIEAIKKMCIEVNYKLSDDVEDQLRNSISKEESILGKHVLEQLNQNLDIAFKDSIPICQDTGMAVVFIKIGQNVHIEGMHLEDAINEGIRQGYEEGFLRKSIVKDPIIRENTKDNTPAVIHYEIVEGDKLEIIITPKGFGSENTSKIYMLKPSDGIDGIKNAVLETVKMAGPNACPPLFIGVGVGGTFEKAAILAKLALTRDTNIHSNKPHIRALEKELYREINALGMGPGGLGGKVTVLSVNIETYPTHIAGLPVAVNICCHVNRHINKIL